MMKIPKLIGKTALYGFIIVCFAVVTLAAYAMIKQHAKDAQFVREELLPLAAHVDQFRAETGRLPAEEEFEAWARVAYPDKSVFYYVHKPAFCRSWGAENRDFLVGIWRGEWVHYYCSWNGKDFKGE